MTESVKLDVIKAKTIGGSCCSSGGQKEAASVRTGETAGWLKRLVKEGGGGS